MMQQMPPSRHTLLVLLESDDFCIKRLLPNKLKNQYCFKTKAAIECLKFVESEKICLK